MIRRATLADLPAVMELAAAVEHTPHWTRAQYEPLVEAGVFGVAEVNGALAGFVAGSVVLGEGELESIAVGVPWRRRGLGRQLLTWFLHHSEAEVVRLEVRSSNEKARSLYRLTGFAESARRAGYYSCPVEDAVLMEYRVSFLQDR